MSPAPAVGILGIGTYLPPIVRGNDFWPAATVARWMQARGGGPPPAAPATDGVARVMRAMAEYARDPFHGVVSRHVMPDDMTAADMELAAAEQAIARAGVARDEIDLVLTHTLVPEYLLSNTACVLHHRLGLAPSCLSTQVEAAAYSFLAQLALAEQMIAGGIATNALLVQSSAITRLLDADEPVAPVFGDAASAVVVGAVRARRGVVARVHRSEGAHPRTLVATTSTGRWYDAGRALATSLDPVSAREVFLGIADRATEAIGAALEVADQRPDSIDVFACHQGMPWLRRVVQEQSGLTRARSRDTFPTSGNVFSVSIPLVLAGLEREGAVRDDDLVLLFGGGTGQTFGATLLRWGR